LLSSKQEVGVQSQEDAESIIEELSVQRGFKGDLILNRMSLLLAKARWLLSRRNKSRRKRKVAAASDKTSRCVLFAI
jgi:hypothetical protein